MDSSKYILLTIDVEDWFQVENFRQWNPHTTWDSRELRAECNVHRLLDLFDSIALKTQSNKPNLSSLISSDQRSELNRDQLNYLNEPNKPNQHSQLSQPRNPKEVDFQPQTSVLKPPSLPASQLPSIKKPKATFFVLGWLAERLPHMVREIQARGHEIASHGYNHEMPNSLALSDLKDDLIKSKNLLEDIIGAAVIGYRAPSFAINDDILKTIGDCGYQYDSSYNSFSLHDRYGSISLNGSGRKGIAHRVDENFYELPISNLRLLNQILPLGGGGYFRLLPWWAFRIGVNSIINKNRAYLFYMHPWEIDPGQPRVESASISFKFRHYTNLHKTEIRLRNLIGSFNYCRFVSCREYLSSEQGS